MKVEYLDQLSVTEIADGAWRLNTVFRAIVQDGSHRYLITIPPGFVTDFCSVPHIPFAYLLFGGIGNKAGLVHDALYSDWGGITVVDIELELEYLYDRGWADNVLAAGLEACSVGWFKRGSMYAAVRTFGWQFYKKR